MHYKLIATHPAGKKETFELRAESIVDIQSALETVSKYPTRMPTYYSGLVRGFQDLWRIIRGESYPHSKECTSDTLERVSKVPVPYFDY